jgi:hypothetical protein
MTHTQAYGFISQNLPIKKSYFAETQKFAALYFRLEEPKRAKLGFFARSSEGRKL